MTTMITTQDQMGQALEQIGRVYQALAALRAEVEPINPGLFAVLAEGHLEDIHRLQRQVDEYSGVVASEEAAASIWLRVVGPEIEWESAPTSVLTAILDAFRKGIQSVAEMILTGDLSARPTALLQRSADFRIVSLAPGSLRVGVRWPDAEPDAGETTSAVAQALDEYLKTAAWLDSEASHEQLTALVPDERRRRLLLNEVGRLVPRERGRVERVEFSGARVREARVPERITLSRQAKTRIERALEGVAEQRVEIRVGDLREIDLDECSFLLRSIEGPENEGVTVRCGFQEDLLEAAKDALDKRVRVTGTRPISDGRRARPLAVSRIEIIEER